MALFLCLHRYAGVKRSCQSLGHGYVHSKVQYLRLADVMLHISSTHNDWSRFQRWDDDAGWVGRILKPVRTLHTSSTSHNPSRPPPHPQSPGWVRSNYYCTYPGEDDQFVASLWKLFAHSSSSVQNITSHTVRSGLRRFLYCSVLRTKWRLLRNCCCSVSSPPHRSGPACVASPLIAIAIARLIPPSFFFCALLLRCFSLLQYPDGISTTSRIERKSPYKVQGPNSTTHGTFPPFCHPIVAALLFI